MQEMNPEKILQFSKELGLRETAKKINREVLDRNLNNEEMDETDRLIMAFTTVAISYIDKKQFEKAAESLSQATYLNASDDSDDDDDPYM